MFWIFSWVIFSLVVGISAKLLHPGDDPIGFLPTIGIGIVGSLVGGLLQWLFMGGPFAVAGLLWSIIGGVIFCYIYKRFHLSKYLTAQKAEIEAQKVKIQNLESKQ